MQSQYKKPGGPRARAAHGEDTDTRVKEYFGGERQTKKRGDRGETDQRETRLWYSYKNLEDKLLT